MASDDLDYLIFRSKLYNRNKQYSKPDWNITTFKTDKEEEDFLKWVDKRKIPFDPNDPFPDYDLRGFYKAMLSGDEKATSGINPKDNKMHFSDYWKTPYHESFSNESQWATKDAPAWINNKLVDIKTGKILKQ